MSSCQEGLWWVPEFQKGLGRRAKDSCMAGHHSIMKPWQGIHQSDKSLLPCIFMNGSLVFLERIFNHELKHIR